MNEIAIESNLEANQDFTKFAKDNEFVFIEETSSLDGQKIISLIIENLPAIITSVTALIAALRSKNIPYKILKNGEEIKELKDADTK